MSGELSTLILAEAELNRMALRIKVLEESNKMLLDACKAASDDLSDIHGRHPPESLAIVRVAIARFEGK